MKIPLIACLLYLCIASQSQAADQSEPLAALLGMHSVGKQAAVDASGSKDSFDEFSKTARLGGVTYVPQGTYWLSRPFSPPPEILLLLAGATISSKNLSDIGDLVGNPTFSILKTSNVPGTDETLNVGLNVRPGIETGHYQKSALFVRTTQNEGSPESQCGQKGISGCKDAVGATFTGNIGASVNHGRAFAANFSANVPKGSTGSATAFEADIGNETGIDSTDDFFTQAHQSGKFGSVIVCVGNAPCDAAVYVTSQAPHPNRARDQPQWLDGLRILSSSLRANGGFAFRLLNDLEGDLRNVVASVDRVGNARFASMTLGEPLPAKSGGTGDAGTEYSVYDPVLRADGGVFGTRPPKATGRYKVLAKTVFVELAITFSSDFSRGHPTAKSYRISLPREPLSFVMLGGKVITGRGKHVDLSSDRGDPEVSYFDGTTAAGDNVSIVASGSYEMK